jgi:pimeloyl-ACP methyl ester carboxylesterase
MTDFVLVHGAWHGGWCWRYVADRLTAAGHRVFTPTLTGLGERSHLLTADVGLDTHITDIVNVIRWEELSDAVLVGHSYAGYVVSGATEQIAGQLKAVALVDAFLPSEDSAMIDDTTQGLRDAIAAAPKTGIIALPGFPASALGCSGTDADWVDELCTPHPIKTYTDRITVTGGLESVPTKLFVRTAFPAANLDETVAQVTGRPGWQVATLNCGHDAMVADPDGLTALLETLA